MNEDNLATPTGAGYAANQLAKALTTAESHDDPEVRVQAEKRIAKWQSVLTGMLNQSLSVGDRTPLQNVPAWVTLEVVTGGFATGNLLAGGDLQPLERALLARIQSEAAASILNVRDLPAGDPLAIARATLNGYYLTDAGLAELQNLLRSGRYEINVPEEAAFLVVAWLLQHGHADTARDLLEQLAPWFARLRFYPVPSEHVPLFGARVFLQDVAQTVKHLQQVQSPPRLLEQHEAIQIWAPLYDRMIELFLETVEGEVPNLNRNSAGGWTRSGNGRFPVIGGWPCQHYPEGWSQQATALLDEYTQLRRKHIRCGRPDRPGDSFSQLRSYLLTCTRDPSSLQGRDVGRIRLILARHIAKHGAPDSLEHQRWRAAQVQPLLAPSHSQLANVLISRLADHVQNDGLDSLDEITQGIREVELSRLVPEPKTLDSTPDSDSVHATVHATVSIPIPPSLQRKVQRCQRDTVETLVARGIITSAETLARVLPQMTAGVRAAGISDPALRSLYAASDRAFRRRRSLLLINLQSQVRIEELPWMASMQTFRSPDLPTQELARQTLEDVTRLTFSCFPQAIVPNKLIQELHSLNKDAGLNLPLVEEVASDIFMGAFSPKFLEAARQSASHLENSLYARYYGIDTAQLRDLGRAPSGRKAQDKLLEITKRASGNDTASAFMALCESRAGVRYAGWQPATNGMIIEQEQILTTHNLAVLYHGLNLHPSMHDQLEVLVRTCFTWICRRLQIKTDRWHARLIQVKNTAYAWRQMLFFLSLLSEDMSKESLAWMEAHFRQQPKGFQQRFGPAILGLRLVMAGQDLDGQKAIQLRAKRFVGWSNSEHWLLED